MFFKNFKVDALLIIVNNADKFAVWWTVCVPFKYGLCVSKKHDLSKGQCLVQELSAQLTEFVYSVSGEQ